MNKQEYRAARRLVRDNGMAHGLKLMHESAREVFTRLQCPTNDYLAFRADWIKRPDGTPKTSVIRLTTPFIHLS